MGQGLPGEQVGLNLDLYLLLVANKINFQVFGLIYYADIIGVGAMHAHTCSPHVQGLGHHEVRDTKGVKAANTGHLNCLFEGREHCFTLIVSL